MRLSFRLASALMVVGAPAAPGDEALRPFALPAPDERGRLWFARRP